MSPSGQGFPTFLENFLRMDRKAFADMESDFSGRFPEYQIHLLKAGGNNELSFGAPGSGELPCESVSDGALLYLAYLALTHHPSPPRILLVEEPENGVHHGSLQDIVAALHAVSSKKRVQVMLTTHSPYLLDLVEPEEVRVFAKDGEGAVHAAKLSDFPDVEDMKKHFMTGEIWTTFDDSEIVAKARGKR